MNEIEPDYVNRCFLDKLRDSVTALRELAELTGENSKLLELVGNSVKDEFDKTAQKITENINKLVRQYNNRECVIAGLSPEVKEVGDKVYSQNIWMEVRTIGIKRIGDTSAWAFTIDNEEVPGSGLSEELAMRLFKSIDAFRTARNDRRAAHE